jgi:hypothetical protein
VLCGHGLQSDALHELADEAVERVGSPNAIRRSTEHPIPRSSPSRAQSTPNRVSRTEVRISRTEVITSKLYAQPRLPDIEAHDYTFSNPAWAISQTRNTTSQLLTITRGSRKVKGDVKFSQLGCQALLCRRARLSELNSWFNVVPSGVYFLLGTKLTIRRATGIRSCAIMRP